MIHHAAASFKEVYDYLGLARVKLYDAPGAGTQSHPAATYFTDKKLYAFDCIFLIYDGSFLESCKQILEEAHAWGKAVAFLRTKADRLSDDVMYNSGIDDEQTVKEQGFSSNLVLRRNLNCSTCTAAVKSLLTVMTLLRQKP